MKSLALRTPLSSDSMQKVLLRDKSDFNQWATDLGLKPAYNKDQQWFARPPASYPAIVVHYRAVFSGGLTGAEFCWEYVYPSDFPVASTGPSDPAAAVADSSTAANASRQNTEDACK